MRPSGDSDIRNICVKNGVANLGMRSLKIEVLEGCGWIVHNNKDIFVDTGEQIELGESLYPIVISPVRQNQVIVFNLERDFPAKSLDRLTEKINDNRLNVERSIIGLKTLVTSISNLLVTK